MSWVADGVPRVTTNLRVQIAGSAAIDADGERLRNAHATIATLVHTIADRGYGLVVGVGGEPLGEAGEACVFDWTIIEALAGVPDQPEASRNARFVVVGSQSAITNIPEHRRALWDKVTGRRDLALKLSPPGWRIGAIVRQNQVRMGDILVALGGGAGVEHLATLYSQDGKSVVPVRTGLGALSQDGIGGADHLQELALSAPAGFFQMKDGAGDPATRLHRLDLGSARSGAELGVAIADVVGDLRARPAFYVRLLAGNVPEYAQVEQFFRNAVDPAMTTLGFTPHEIGREDPVDAFLNVEIFRGIHYAGLVVVDLTAVRPNCLMELGYALARQRRVVVSAREGTKLPFDEDKLRTFFWTEANAWDETQRQYELWCERTMSIPPIVSGF